MTVPDKRPPRVRRNPGRMDEMTWKSTTFVCSEDSDGVWDNYEERQETRDEYEQDPLPARTMQIFLLDIARPAKPKKVAAHDFQVVRALPRVMSFRESETDYSTEDEQWEKDLSDRGDVEQVRKTYSDALRGSGC